MPRKKKASKSKGAPTKSDFIRQHSGLSGPEVVAKAKEAGIELSLNTVHKIRSADKVRAARKGKAEARKATKRAAKKTARKTANERAQRTNVGANDLEQQFLMIVLDIGLSRAGALLEQVRERARSLVG